MDKIDPKRLEAEADALIERISAAASNTALGQEDSAAAREVTEALVAEYGSEDAAERMVDVLLAQLAPALPANDAAPVLDEKFVDLAAFDGPQRTNSRPRSFREQLEVHSDLIGRLTHGSDDAELFRRGGSVFLHVRGQGRLSVLSLGNQDYLLQPTEGSSDEFVVVGIDPKAARHFSLWHQQDPAEFPVRWS